MHAIYAFWLFYYIVAPFYNFFFLTNIECPNLFKYLTILSNVCSLSASHALDYYKNKSYRGGPKMLTKSFKPKILWILSILRKYSNPLKFIIWNLFFFFFFFLCVENQLKSKFQPIIYRWKIYGVNTLSVIWIYIYIYIYKVFVMYIYDCMH